MIAAVGRGELAIDVDDDTSFVRAGRGLVGGKDARGCCGDGERFVFGR